MKHRAALQAADQQHAQFEALHRTLYQRATVACTTYHERKVQQLYASHRDMLRQREGRLQA
jgi:hypothetical protein